MGPDVYFEIASMCAGETTLRAAERPFSGVTHHVLLEMRRLCEGVSAYFATERFPPGMNQHVIERDDLGEKKAGDQFSRSSLAKPAPNSLKWCSRQCKVRQNPECCYNPTCSQKRKEACHWMGYVTGEEYTY